MGDLNRGVVSMDMGRSTSLATTTTSNKKEGAGASPPDTRSVTLSPTWWFDGGDYDIGYLPYDVESNQHLEEAYQTMLLQQNEIRHVDADNSNATGKISPEQATTMTSTTTTTTITPTHPESNRTVLLSSGKYSVD